MFIRLLAIILLVVNQAAARAFVEAVDAACSKDACLKTVIANSRKAQGTGCTAFFRKTVIPATSTKTVTTQIPTTITKTITSVSTSKTTEFASTTTSVSTVRKRTTTTSTTKTTIVVTTTITLPSPPSNVEKRTKRAKPTTTSQTTVPKYASAVCANTVAYSSACSCISAPHQTTTLPTPVSTKTVTRFSSTVTRTVEPTTTTATIVKPKTLTEMTTTTVTSTSTKTVTRQTISIKTTTTTSSSPACTNAGIQWAYYPYAGTQNPPFTGYDPATYKNVVPAQSGTYNGIGGFSVTGNGVFTPYGSMQAVPSTQFVLSHRGYIYAAVAGTYSFTISSVDDLVDLWVGSIAYSGWTRANSLGEAIYGTPTSNSPGSVSKSITLSKGYTPFRIIFLQSGGDGSFSVTVKDPSADVVATSGSPSANIVQFGCKASDNAPQFPPFGSET